MQACLQKYNRKNQIAKFQKRFQKSLKETRKNEIGFSTRTKPLKTMRKALINRPQFADILHRFCSYFSYICNMNEEEKKTYEELGQVITNTDADLDCQYLRLLTISAVQDVYEAIDDLDDLNGKTSGELRIMLDRFFERLQYITKRYQAQQKSDPFYLSEETAKSFNLTLERLLDTIKG